MNILKALFGFLTFNKDKSLTGVVKYNIIASYLFNGLSMIISFVSVPLFIRLLNDSQYGVWLTIFSFLNWLSILDFGLGLGLRNKFPEALAKDDKKKAKNYIEVTYLITILLSAFFFIVVLLITKAGDFNVILNVKDGQVPENMNVLMLMIVLLYGFQFVGNNVNGLLHSIQKSRFLVFIDFMAKLISLLGLLLLIHLELPSLYVVAVITMLSRILLTAIFTIYFYQYVANKYNLKFAIFSVKNIRQKLFLLIDDNLLSLSIKFFIINISSIFLINSTNYLITYLYSPAEVIPFSISFKLFSSLLFLFYLFLAPFWSAFTESYLKKDYDWIINTLNKMLIGYGVFLAIVFLIYMASQFLYVLWIADDVHIPDGITFAVSCYVCIMAWNALFSHFLNGINKLDIQLRIALIHIVTNIPFCILMSQTFGFGIEGLIWATNINLLLLSIILPRQVYNTVKTLKNI